jgi:hypothetical protein
MRKGLDGRTRISQARWRPLIGCALVCVPGWAWGLDVSAGLGLLRTYTDNALSTAENPISEQQDEVQASLSGEHSGDWLSANIAYNAAHTAFSKDSQEARNSLEGDTRLTWGTPSDRAQLLLSHSRRQLLNSPGARPLLVNTDERDLFTLNPVLNLRLSPVDQLHLGAEQTQVAFKFAQNRDSTRDTGRLQWQHRLSERQGLALQIQHTDVSFDARQDLDYTYQLAQLSYASQLRHWAYSLNAGYNQSDSPNNGRFGSPSYDLSAQYDHGPQRWALQLNSSISDTALGDANQGALSEDLPLDAIGQAFDQVKRQTLLASWTYQSLCARCSLTLSGGQQREDYLNLPEDVTEQHGELQLNYRWRPQTQMGLSYRHSRSDFLAGALSSDFQETLQEWHLQHRFVGDFLGALRIGQRSRDADRPIDTFDETLYSLEISYSYD